MQTFTIQHSDSSSQMFFRQLIPLEIVKIKPQFCFQSDLICSGVPPEVALVMAQAASFLVRNSAFCRISISTGKMFASITVCGAEQDKLSGPRRRKAAQSSNARNAEFKYGGCLSQRFYLEVFQLSVCYLNTPLNQKGDLPSCEDIFQCFRYRLG